MGCETILFFQIPLLLIVLMRYGEAETTDRASNSLADLLLWKPDSF